MGRWAHERERERERESEGGRERERERERERASERDRERERKRKRERQTDRERETERERERETDRERETERERERERESLCVGCPTIILGCISTYPSFHINPFPSPHPLLTSPDAPRRLDHPTNSNQRTYLVLSLGHLGPTIPMGRHQRGTRPEAKSPGAVPHVGLRLKMLRE